VFGSHLEPLDADHSDAVELRWDVTAALATLPPRQRAVLVLRFEQLSETETAAVLGCSVGTVKSSASRGLQRLRGAAALDHELRLSI
jgi:RNA polymerase sigma factor (sigma-70 family)